MTTRNEETWRSVVGSSVFEVSDYGRVRNAKTGVVRKLQARPSGHLTVRFENKTRHVHRMVLEAFVGPAPENTECCHNNGDPQDNRVANLRWDTRSSNRRDSVNHGTHVSVYRYRDACGAGHPYVSGSYRMQVRQNTRARICKQCATIRQQAYKRRKEGVA